MRRLLVANRGEIALRIVRAARARGIETVLAASSADRDSMASREADRTVVIGPAPARASYLDARLLVHAALATGCDGLHPGYGFLSERVELAELCQHAGVVFVGPTPQSIRQVGDKLAARALAREAGIPLVEGSGPLGSSAEALRLADTIGYPVVTKASAGGGGRGMVVARDAQTLAKNFEKASSEAREAFGDGTLYLERYVERARHVEVQVLGDSLGGVLHFGERDCSIQRRYQKMVEEAPAAILPEAVRQRLHGAAVSLLSPIQYRNAGTVEFLFDVDRQDFHFMEVNARIQVEHPVSEEIHGVDLIGLQLAVAAMEPIGLAQTALRPFGHAIEVRIVAEDPHRGFTPSPGRITEWRPPSGPGVRIDTAMGEGMMVSPFYDSMIAKLIVHGENRDQAVARLRKGLDQFVIGGVKTNLQLLRAIVAHQDFVNNRVGTGWLEHTFLPLFAHSSGG